MDSLDTERLRNEVTATLLDNDNWADMAGEEDVVMIKELPIQFINEQSMDSLPKYSPKPDRYEPRS